MPSLRGLDSAVLTFASGESGITVALTAAVVLHFDMHRQCTGKHTEAGGQLFARFADITISIEKATGPRRTDRRSPWSFLPDRLAERREINLLFKQGLHFVGDWHTHPQTRPAPSGTDMASFREMFQRSRHELSYFVMVIVGTDPAPDGLFVALINGKRSLVLRPLSSGIAPAPTSPQ